MESATIASGVWWCNCGKTRVSTSIYYEYFCHMLGGPQMSEAHQRQLHTAAEKIEEARP